MGASPENLKRSGSVLGRLSRLALLLSACVMLTNCGGGGGGSSTTPPTPPQPPPATEFLSQTDVQMLVQAAATAANSDSSVIAVVDRLGRILAVYKGPTAPATSPGTRNEEAVDIYKTVLRSYPQRDVASQAKASLRGVDQ